MSRTDFSRSYQKSPIIFQGGIAAQLPDGTLPIVAITQAADFGQGVLNNPTQTPNAAFSDNEIDHFFFDFSPVAGGTLIDNQVSIYPFANQTTAANNQQGQPLSISLSMVAPVNTQGGYAQKLSLFTALKKTLDIHQQLGGTFIIATPSYYYQNCLLTALRDLSNDVKRPQDMWQWTFMQPLLTLAAARAAQNQLMQKVSGGQKLTPDANGNISASGLQPSIGTNTGGASGATLPISQAVAGTSVSGTNQSGHVGPL